MPSFEVPFVAGKQRHRTTKTGHTYTPRETVRDEASIAEAAREAMREAGKDCFLPRGTPAVVSIDVYEPMPRSRPRKVMWEPDTYKPDADNVAKLVMDGLNGVMWDDDAQVVDIHVRKWPRRRGTEPHMVVHVSRGWEPSGEKEERNG